MLRKLRLLTRRSERFRVDILLRSLVVELLDPGYALDIILLNSRIMYFVVGR